jgi:PleD family two-component response regulator
VAQRVRRAVADLAVPAVGADGREHLLTGLTVSIGVATTQRFGYELPDLLVAADAALLAAKGYGRNLVEMA